MKIEKHRNALHLSFIIFAALILSSCGKEVYVVAVKNNSKARITDVVEFNNPDKELLNMLTVQNYYLFDHKVAVPFEVVTNPLTGTPSLLLQTQLEPGAEKQLFIRNKLKTPPRFEKKTQAELWVKEGGQFVGTKYEGGSFVRIDSLPVPEGFTDHAYYIKYEGPGWESDKVGFRFYLDWRNAVDVFGKKVNTMVLNDVGQDGYDSYHEPADWGMDVLKVGNTLGIGSIAHWNGESARRVDSTERVVSKISKDGILRSEVTTNYYGWSTDSGKYDMSSIISIDAGSRMTRQFLIFDGEAPGNICTGIAKDKNAQYFEIEHHGDWACMATWGPQSLADDHLGLAVFYKKSTLVKKTMDKINYVVVLKPKENRVEYCFAAAWEQEPDGIKTLDDFKNYINWQLDRLNYPAEML